MVTEYVDNSVSAFRAKRRPAFEQMLADVATGRFTVLLAWHPDRLYRRLSDLERFTDTVRAAGVDVLTVRAGDLDLSSATGRMVAGILGSVARGESERMGERVSRAKQQRAAQGRPAGGGRRPFGFLDDRITLHPTEAPLLAAAAARVATGQSTYAAECDRLNQAGVTTGAGTLWTIRSLSRTCTSPRSAGLRAYKGVIVRDAVWPPIVDREHWDTLNARRAARSQGGRPPTAPHLLRGLLECGRCGRRLYTAKATNGPVYRCVPVRRADGRGCGSCQVKVDVLDTFVLDTVRGWLLDDDVTQVVNQPVGDHARIVRAQVELEQLEQRRGVLTERFMDGKLSPVEYDQAMERTDATRVRIEGVLAGTPEPVAGLAGMSLAELRAALDDEPAIARAVVEQLAETPIVLAPAGRKGVPTPIGERVHVRPRWA